MIPEICCNNVMTIKAFKNEGKIIPEYYVCNNCGKKVEAWGAKIKAEKEKK